MSLLSKAVSYFCIILCLSTCKGNAEPLGVSLNNPGNIERGQHWIGLAVIQKHKRFATFSEPRYGIRAMCKTINTYGTKYKLKTVGQVIFRWSPPMENGISNTLAYTHNVSNWSGLALNETVDLSDKPTLTRIVYAMIRQENGYNPFTPQEIANACTW